MAVITPTIEGGQLNGSPPRGTAHVQYGPFATGDTCNHFELPQFGDKTVSVIGTLGTETVTIQGNSIKDPTTGLPHASGWQTLGDPQGNALTFTSGTLRTEQILEIPRWIRPLIGGGAGASAVFVGFVCRREKGVKQTG